MTCCPQGRLSDGREKVGRRRAPYVPSHEHHRPSTRPNPPPIRALPGVCIEAEGVSRVLRSGNRILSEVSVAVEPGRLVAVIGASGSGKTTLLETLAGLRTPSSGQVLLDGRDVHRDREELHGAIGYVPQDDIIHRDLPCGRRSDTRPGSGCPNSQGPRSTRGSTTPSTRSD